MDLIQKYYNNACLRDDVNFIAENSLKWLQELFDLEDYDYNSQRMFTWYGDFFVKFLSNELFSNDGCVELIFPRGMYDQNSRRSYEKATAYFLLNQHYSKLNATQKDDKIKEDLSKLDRVESEADFDSIKNTAKKTQWRLYADDLAHQYIWAGEEYEPQTEGCVQIGIEVTIYMDFNYKPENQERNKVGDLDFYVKYLLTKERNTIENFTNSNVFWNGAVRLTTRNHAERMEEQILSQKEWLLFCLALGMDYSVFRKLIRLQYQKFGNNGAIIGRLDFIGDNETYMLKKFLMDSYWRLRDAKRDVGNVRDRYAIPRRMIVNANDDLIKDRLQPILPSI